MSSALLIQDLRYLDHNPGKFHPESPQRLQAIARMLEESGLEKKGLGLEPREASLEEIALIHTREHIHAIENTSHYDEFDLDADTHTSSPSFNAAKLAVGGVLTGVDALLSGQAEQGFVFPRPPGHHAEKDHAMGFCLFNNVAIAAEYLIRKKNLKKIAIFDFDVHHGNGTQHLFENRSDVFYISTHQYPFYPGTGASHEVGKGEGEGYTLNLPLRAKTSDGEYLEIFREKVIPALRDYRPDFLLLSAGFDGHALDPLGGLHLTRSCFRQIAEDTTTLQKELAQIPVLYALEGGYHLQALPESVKEVVEVMLNA